MSYSRLPDWEVDGYSIYDKRRNSVDGPVKVVVEFTHSTYGDLNHKKDMDKLGWELHRIEEIRSDSQYNYDRTINVRAIECNRRPIKVHKNPPNNIVGYDTYIIQSTYFIICDSIQHAKREAAKVINNTKEFFGYFDIKDVDYNMGPRKVLRFCPLTCAPLNGYWELK